MTRLSASADPQRPHVVIADDCLVQRRTMAVELERAGFAVSMAPDGETGLDTVRAVRPDVFIVDAVMPGMSGFDVIEELRRDPELVDLPTMVVSGLEDIASRVRALTLGADDFVSKPVDGSELVARVRARLRSRVHSGLDAEQPAVRDRSRWLTDVIDRRRFDLHFQPIVCIASGSTQALEALVRFEDGTRPDEVFDAPDHHALVTQLELAILARTIETSTERGIGVPVHVNLSPRAATHPGVADLIRDARHEIVLEVTEHECFGAAEANNLRAATSGRCHLAADDVGAGFAGLAQLLGMRPDIIKIDREIIRGVDTDPARQVVVAGLVDFARTTGADLIGEGVETADEARTLADLGVRLGQGYHFGRPQPLVDGADHRVGIGAGVLAPTH